MSNAFAALIWWVVPAAGLIGGLGYVVWVTKFQGKFQQETQRSVGQFQRFQDSLRDSQARDAGVTPLIFPGDASHHDVTGHVGHSDSSGSDAGADAGSDGGSAAD
jgi:hypothetical protein